MRITRSMMVNDMLYWTAKQLEKLNDASTVVASGKQINKPSDDPSATGQILSDRATLSIYSQYESNVAQAETWIETSNTTLDAVTGFLGEAQDILSSLSSADEETSEDYLEVLESIYDQIMDLANSKYGSSYMYGGNISDAVPFSNSVSITTTTSGVTVPENIIFDLAGDASELINLTVEITVTDSKGEVIREIMETGITGVEGTNTLSWNGLDDDGNALPNGDYEFTVTVANSEGDSGAAYASYRGDEGGKAVIIGEGSSIILNNHGGEIFSKALSALSQAIAAVKNSDDDAYLASDLADIFGEAISAVETEQVTLANINTQLEYKSDRLEQLVTNIESDISNVEVGSTEEAAIKLEAQETSYEVTLEAVANVLKMTKLSDLI